MDSSSMTHSPSDSRYSRGSPNGSSGGGGLGATSGVISPNDSIEHHKKLLSTLSPEGLQVAAQITPTRLARLLILKGPLPIRHITSHLSQDVPSFDMLSLSKQRRLIMAAMEQTDPENNVVFEKIGWGQWAVRKVDSDYIVSETTEGSDKKPINVNELRNQGNLRLGWSKRTSKTPSGSRRESITNNKTNLHNVKLPNEEFDEDSNAIESESDDEYGLSDNVERENADPRSLDDVLQEGSDDNNDDDDIDDDDDADDDDDDDDDANGLFAFDLDERMKTSPPVKFANRVPFKISPPPINSTSRRKSSSSNPSNSIGKIASNHRHQIFNRSRLNSLDNLDNYILSSARNSNISISSPPPPVAAASALSGSPVNSWNSGSYMPRLNPSLESFHANSANRRKSSFNESHIRSTLSASLPKSTQPEKPLENHEKAHHEQSDTDEEDWASIGAKQLRKRQSENSVKAEKDDETNAANALMNLMSV